jgi:hypothetical protein
MGVVLDSLAAKTQVIEMLMLDTQIDHDIAQRFASVKLVKELIDAGEIFDLSLCTPSQNHAA